MLVLGGVHRAAKLVGGLPERVGIAEIGRIVSRVRHASESPNNSPTEIAE